MKGELNVASIPADAGVLSVSRCCLLIWTLGETSRRRLGYFKGKSLTTPRFTSPPTSRLKTVGTPHNICNHDLRGSQ
jgi:hypothetical protein